MDDHRKQSKKSIGQRFWQRIVDKKKAPRNWWTGQESITFPSDEEWQREHDEVSNTIRRVMIGFTAYCLFCVLALGAPDRSLIANDASINIPFANTEVSFSGFLLVGPLILVGLFTYLQIFVGHLQKIPTPSNKRPLPYIFNITTAFTGLLSDLLLYWLAPFILLVFAWKAAPRSEGVTLLVAAMFLMASVIFLTIRRFRWSAPITLKQRVGYFGLWLILFSLVGGPIVMFSEIVGIWYRPLSLYKADLKGLDMERANLKGANLEGAKLHNANLRFASLQNANLRDAELQKVNLMDAFLWNAKLQRANLRDTQLTGANLADANLANADLTDANLENTDMRGTNLQGANLENVDMRRANLRDAQLQNARLENADIRDAKLHDANLEGARLRNANLAGAKLYGAIMVDAYLKAAKLQRTILEGANLRDAQLQNANLERAHLWSANLKGANLKGANLSGASLRGANLADANLEGANLQDVDLMGANLEYAELAGVRSLTCEQLTKAQNWSSAFRAEWLVCGGPTPQE